MLTINTQAEYNQFLQTIMWDRTVRWYKKQVPELCRVCGTTENLTVYHKRYAWRFKNDKRKIINKEKVHHMVILCKECHQDIAKYKLFKYAINGAFDWIAEFIDHETRGPAFESRPFTSNKEDEFKDTPF